MRKAVKDIKNLKSAKLDSKAKQLIEIITELSPDEWEPPFLRDLINPVDIVLMITPIDSSAPKGRMIMPQVRAWRDILDGGGIAFSCEPQNLQKTLDSLKNKPALVVTDSQVFSKVAPNSSRRCSFHLVFDPFDQAERESRRNG